MSTKYCAPGPSRDAREDELRIVSETLDALHALQERRAAHYNTSQAQYSGDMMDAPIHRTAACSLPDIAITCPQAKFTGRAVVGTWIFLPAALGIAWIIGKCMNSIVVMSLIATVALLAWPVYVFLGGLAGWGDKLDAPRIKHVKESEAYKLACRNAEIEASQLQAKYDKQYEDALKLYKQVHPVQVAAMEEWEHSRSQCLERLKVAIDESLSAVTSLYSVNLIPTAYRSVDALTFIKETMDSSEYTLKEACRLFEIRKSQELEQDRIKAQNQANAIAHSQLAAQQEANAIADQARRDAARHAAVAAVQRHNTNKYLKSLK